MNPDFSLADFQHLKDYQPMRKQDLFSPTLWFIWAQFWNQWTQNSLDQLKFWVMPTFYPRRPRGQPWHELILEFLPQLEQKLRIHFNFPFLFRVMLQVQVFTMITNLRLRRLRKRMQRRRQENKLYEKWMNAKVNQIVML